MHTNMRCTGNTGCCIILENKHRFNQMRKVMCIQTRLDFVVFHLAGRSERFWYYNVFYWSFEWRRGWNSAMLLHCQCAGAGLSDVCFWPRLFMGECESMRKSIICRNFHDCSELQIHLNILFHINCAKSL